VIKYIKKYLLIGLLGLVCIIWLANEYVSLRRSSDPFIAIKFPDINITLFLEGAEDFTRIQFIKPTKPPKVEGFTAVYVTLYGEGTIAYKNFYMQYNDKELQINGREIGVVYGAASSYVITTKGKIIPRATLKHN